jgi:hypothetical protein
MHLADRTFGQRTSLLVADLDFHVLDRLAAIHDRPVALGPVLGGIAA